MKSNLAILRGGITQQFCTPSRYPISLLLLLTARKFADSPLECCKELKLTNQKRSAKRLNRWIAEAEGHMKFLHEFGKATGASNDIQRALEDTKELQATEKKAQLWRTAEATADGFQPSLFVIPEATRPRQIFVEAITKGRFRMLPWESYRHEGVTEARIRAGLTCEKHYKESLGQCRNWGPIKQYCFAEAWNQHSIIGTDGSILRVVEEPCPMLQATLCLTGRRKLQGMV